MIWRPLPGMRVRLRYRNSLRAAVEGLHLAVGTVMTSGYGPGPINVEIKLDDGRRVVVPRGNLFRLPKEAHDAHAASQ